MKRKVLLPGLVFCLLQLSGAAVFAQSPPSKVDFAWLTGQWQGKVGGGIFYEQWRKISPTEFAGTGFMLMNGDTVMNEKIKLHHNGTTWAYTVTEGNQQPVTFLLTKADGGSYRFENKAHDFPQHIIYTPKPKNALHVLVEGPQQGSWQKIDFNLTKTGK